MRRVPHRPASPVASSRKALARAAAAVFAVVLFFAAEAPAHAAGSVPLALPAPSTGLNAVIAAVVGLAAGGVTFYLRTRGRRSEDRD